MKKNKFILLIALFAAVFTVFSCSKSEDPYLQVNKTNIEIAADATAASFSIQSNVDWRISASDTWCSVGTSSGSGDATINITAQTHTSHSPRTVTFTVSSSSLPEGSVKVTLTQSAAPNVLPTAPVLLSPENNATIEGLLPTFTWQASYDENGDAVAYTLKISKDQNTWNTYNTRELSYTVSSKLELNTQYYWMVTASDGVGEVVESEIRTFSTPNISYRAEGEVRGYEVNTQTFPINVIILGDGFIQEDLAVGGACDKAMEKAAEAFFDIEPYRSYRKKFNIYFVYAESQQRGGMYGHGHDGAHVSDYMAFKPNTAFGTTFDAANSRSTSMECNYEKCFKYARYVPGMKVGDDIVYNSSGATGAITDPANPINNCVIILVVNDTRYAGTCSMWNTGACVGMCPMSSYFEPTLRHEVGGHGFAKLCDEYVYQGTAALTQSEIQSFNYWESLGFYKNVSLTNDKSVIKWKSFLGDAKYPEVGIYEGAYMRATGIYRPEEISCMDDNRSYFNGPSRYAIVERIMKISSGMMGSSSYIYPYEDFKAQDKKDPNVPNGIAKSGANLPPLAPPRMFIVE